MSRLTNRLIYRLKGRVLRRQGAQEVGTSRKELPASEKEARTPQEEWAEMLLREESVRDGRLGSDAAKTLAGSRRRRLLSGLATDPVFLLVYVPLGVFVACLVVPFVLGLFDRGPPIEYELSVTYRAGVAESWRLSLPPDQQNELAPLLYVVDRLRPGERRRLYERFEGGPPGDDDGTPLSDLRDSVSRERKPSTTDPSTPPGASPGSDLEVTLREPREPREPLEPRDGSDNWKALGGWPVLRVVADRVAKGEALADDEKQRTALLEWATPLLELSPGIERLRERSDTVGDELVRKEVARVLVEHLPRFCLELQLEFVACTYVSENADDYELALRSMRGVQKTNEEAYSEFKNSLKGLDGWAVYERQLRRSYEKRVLARQYIRLVAQEDLAAVEPGHVLQGTLTLKWLKQKGQMHGSRQLRASISVADPLHRRAGDLTQAPDLFFAARGEASDIRLILDLGKRDGRSPEYLVRVSGANGTYTGVLMQQRGTHAPLAIADVSLRPVTWAAAED